MTAVRQQAAIHSDEFAPVRVNDRFETMVRPHLLVHMMQVVAKRLGGDAELLRDLARRLLFAERGEDSRFLLGQRRHRNQSRGGSAKDGSFG